MKETQAPLRAIGANVLLLAIRVNGFRLDLEMALIAGGASARFAFLKAETAKVISVAASGKETRTR